MPASPPSCLPVTWRATCCGATPGPTRCATSRARFYEGAVAFIRRQYTTIGILALGGSVIIGIVIYLVETPDVADVPSLAGAPIAIMTAIAFLVGAACSMASGIIGMYISVKSNVRTAAAARRSLVEAVQVAMRGGAVSRLPRRRPEPARRVGHLRRLREHSRRRAVAQAPFLIVGFGFGASFVALFAQLGGGIYTKAADVGSDLVGKVEAGIPEDDPRNAGVDRGPRRRQRRRLRRPWRRPLRVDCCREHRRDDPRRRGLLDRQPAGWPNPEAWIFFPLVVRGFGLLATIVAMYFVRGNEEEDPMNILNRGYWATTILSVVGLGITTYG